MAKKIIVIDGNSLLFRAYYATAYGENPSIMRTKTGIPTNAIFAFANMLAKILQSFTDGEAIFVGFDADKDTFRKAEFAAYKANRKPAPADLKAQFPISRELLKSLDIMAYEEHGIEADDICGTVSKMASAAGYEVTVYTSDKDYLQLIDEHISISLLKVGLSAMEVVTLGNMGEKFGFTPAQIVDYKGLRGDDSDNLPGIPGIGDVTAVKLLKEYGGFEAIVKAAPAMSGKIGAAILANEAQGRQCYQLARIKTDAKLPFSLTDLTYHGYDFKAVNDFAQKYELKQFLTRLPAALKKGGGAPTAFPQIEVASFAGIEVTSPIGLSLDLDYDGYHDAPILGIALSVDGRVYWETGEKIASDGALIKILGDPAISKDVYDGKAAIYALHEIGIPLVGIANDLLLAAYLLDSSVTSDPRLVYSSFGVDVADAEEGNLLDPSRPLRTGKMAFHAAQLAPKAKNSLESVDAYKLYRDVEMPLMEVLAQMEIEGFPLNKEKLEEYGKVFSAKKDEVQKAIFALSKEPFNLNSPKQIAEELFVKMGLQDPRGGSTSIEALADIIDESPIIAKILEYRKYAKLMGTYVEGLVPHIKADGKIHSYFNQAQTSTGRLSSSSPNLQNISTRDDESRQIKNAFYYDDPKVSLLSLDYGQIELRILAALSHCQAYIEVFDSGRDVHSETAKKIFHAEEVTPLMRRKAKAVNFAIIYGTTVYGLAQQIGGTEKEAQEIIKAFYLSYPEVGAYLNATIKDAETKGYVTTMFGRRRYLREVNDPNYARREAARRAALNAPVQGSAADLIKIAMVKIEEYLVAQGSKAQMVLQIHDELLFKVPDEELSDLVPALSDIMTGCVELPVKLTVEAGIGKTWFDAKD
jgi:DNA polymerase-1